MKPKVYGKPFQKGHTLNVGRKHSAEWTQKVREKNTREKVQKKCLTCSRVFLVHKSRTDTAKFCSKSCSGKVRVGEKNNMWQGGITTYERKLYLNNQRRILKIGNGGFHLQGEWETLKAQYNWTCPCCKRKEPEIKLTEDHIIPLSKGGSDNIENIQPLCKSCNSRKKNKTINYIKT